MLGGIGAAVTFSSNIGRWVAVVTSCWPNFVVIDMETKVGVAVPAANKLLLTLELYSECY